MIALLEGALTGDLLREVTGHDVHGPLSMLHAAGTATWREKHLIFLAEKGRPPFALAKWGRGQWGEGLASEQAAMRQVRSSDDAALAASCPPSWGPFEVAPGTLVTVERYYPSRSIYAQLRNSLIVPRRRVETHFHIVSAWLTRFGKATLQPARPFDEDMLEEYVAAPLNDLMKRFGAEAAPSGYVEQLIGAAKSHLGRPVPLVAEHGDLWPSNILLPVERGVGFHIVDWEHYRPVSLAGFDVLFFCTTYAREFPWRPMAWLETDAALRRAFVERTWLAVHIERLLDDYCAALGLERSLIPVLLPVMMARLALRHADSEPAGVETPERYWLNAFREWANMASGSWLHPWTNK
jgi:hypothetical protein